VARALRLNDRPVRELMTPRPNVVWLDADNPPEEVLRLARESRHSYFPVARGDLDNLLGLALHSRRSYRARNRPIVPVQYQILNPRFDPFAFALTRCG
jgi:Mg2+/Co2+ transporter CorB